jgi:hypothetical protein
VASSRCSVRLKPAMSDQAFAGRCELDEDPSPVGRVGHPLQEALLLESVEAVAHPA